MGGAVLGIGAAAVGQAAGAVVGGLIDQQILGSGSEAISRGRSSSLRIQGANEGAPVPRVYGRMRVSGQVIWSTRFKEHVSREGGGKGGGPTVHDYSYTVSFAVALCEGPIARIGRVWADGKPIDLDSLNWRLHRGTETQGPDPAIEATEGDAPAFRGVAYLVFEDMPLEPYGNRTPQISIEVIRRPLAPEASPAAKTTPQIQDVVRAVAMSPGSGEFSLETEPVRVIQSDGQEKYANLHASSQRTDAVVALDQLMDELPNVEAVSLIVTWFGDDLRCGRCSIRPGVEYAETRTAPYEWRVAGLDRGQAYLVGRDPEGRPVFGGTPSDASVIRYIRELKARGLRVNFYPFILMDVPAGNAKPDPWGGAEQAAYPWRGRITTELAPGLNGTTDGTGAAAEEVRSFFGDASQDDFSAGDDTVHLEGSEDWGLRRFVLHYAHLCRLAGGVDAFCIGSELRSLTQIRSGRTAYPAVAELCDLADQVRAVVGPRTRIGYAADWSEYFGHQPADGTGDRLFHLDPLWASSSIDFVGVDWYAPLTDWRDEEDHLDAREAASIYDLDYLSSRFSAGEGFDWYYANDEDRRRQVRSPIADGLAGEDWIWRFKDIVGWWSNPHHERVDGARSAVATPWRPRSKPIWLTEIGCGALDKASNQPNIFIDPKSSEDGLPWHSNGCRDDLIQRRTLQAAHAHWSSSVNNPSSPYYGARMVDLANAYVWTWDARPWPEFPRRLDVWSDGRNHEWGHWLNGRTASASLEDIVAEICAEAGLASYDVSGLHGIVEGFIQDRVQTPREALQALMVAFGFDAYETAGTVRFVMRPGLKKRDLDLAAIVADASDDEFGLERVRAQEGVAPKEVRVAYIRSDAEYRSGAVQAISPQKDAVGVTGSDLPVAMSRASALGVAERWARESEVGRETISFSLPNRLLEVEPGDLLDLSDGAGTYRVDRIADGVVRKIAATRVEPGIYKILPPVLPPEQGAPLEGGEAPGRPAYRLLDVPWTIFGGVATRGYVAAWATPWPGSVRVFSSDRDDGYAAQGSVRRPSTVAALLEPLASAAPWVWSRGVKVRVRMLSGSLSSVDDFAVLNGANLAALSTADGQWEILQFQKAELIAPGEYVLSRFLRGQGGTEQLIADPAPAGSTLVLLDNRLLPIDLGMPGLGVERSYRIGPSGADIGSASFVQANWTWRGAALSAHAPAHLTAVRGPSGDILLSWFRRSREEFDIWTTAEVPLDQPTEEYEVTIRSGSQILRRMRALEPALKYSADQQSEDGAAHDLIFEVAQVSSLVGAGRTSKVVFNG